MVNGERAVVSTLAGGANGAYADGSGTNAGFSNPLGVAVDASGNVFVADRNNHRIRKATAASGMLLQEGCCHVLICLYSLCALACMFASVRMLV